MVEYHVFTDNQDEYYDTFKEAKKCYTEFLNEYGTARIYKNIEKDGETEEIYMLGEGSYPL